MPKEFSRSERMAEQIRRDLSELVREEIKDPRIGLISFTAVNLSRDLGSAQIYFTVLNEGSVNDTLQALNHAAGFLRSKIASRINARTVPALKFVHDDSVLRGSSMEQLIEKAVQSDKKNRPDDEGSDNGEA